MTLVFNSFCSCACVVMLCRREVISCLMSCCSLTSCCVSSLKLLSSSRASERERWMVLPALPTLFPSPPPPPVVPLFEVFGICVLGRGFCGAVLLDGGRFVGMFFGELVGVAQASLVQGTKSQCKMEKKRGGGGRTTMR